MGPLSYALQSIEFRARVQVLNRIILLRQFVRKHVGTASHWNIATYNEDIGWH